MSRYHMSDVYLMVALVLSAQITVVLSENCCGSNAIWLLGASRGETRSIYSPRYPGEYPDNCDCHWQLFTDEDLVIHVHVVWIDLEQYGVACPYDYIVFRDERNGPFIRRCTDDMSVEFICDGSISRRGFILEYSAVLPDPVNLKSTLYRLLENLSLITSTPSYDMGWSTLFTHDYDDDPDHDYDQPYSINTGYVIVVASVSPFIVLFVIFFLFQCYVTRRNRKNFRKIELHRARVSPYQPPSNVNHCNNVFMVPSSASLALHPHNHASLSSLHGEDISLDFSVRGEAPPDYLTLQQNNSAVPQPGPGATTVLRIQYCPSPPPYLEAMVVSHPTALLLDQTSECVEATPAGPPIISLPNSTPRAAATPAPTPGDMTRISASPNQPVRAATYPVPNSTISAKPPVSGAFDRPVGFPSTALPIQISDASTPAQTPDHMTAILIVENSAVGAYELDLPLGTSSTA